MAHSLAARLKFLHVPKRLFSVRSEGSVFKLDLPSPAIALISPEGDRLLKEAMEAGTAVGFFHAVSFLHVPRFPTYIGPAVLSSVLNVLHSCTKPQKTYTGMEWGYEEEMLAPMQTMAKIKEVGVTLLELADIALRNALHVDMRLASQSSLEEFRHDVLATMKGNTSFLVCNYSRTALKQDGEQHFTSLGAYHVEKDMVLVLDAEKYKYPYHWLPTNLMWDAMNTVDNSTNLMGDATTMVDNSSGQTSGDTGGYMILSKKSEH